MQGGMWRQSLAPLKTALLAFLHLQTMWQVSGGIGGNFVMTEQVGGDLSFPLLSHVTLTMRAVGAVSVPLAGTEL